MPENPTPRAAALGLLFQPHLGHDPGHAEDSADMKRAHVFAMLDVADAIREQTAVYVEQQNLPEPEELLGALAPALDLARRVAAVQAAEGRNTAASTVNALLVGLDMLLGEVE
jgi:hypothetical protein